MLIQQLLIKLEQDEDNVFALTHKIKSLEEEHEEDCYLLKQKVKYLEQELANKEIEYERLTVDLSDALAECRNEADEMADEMLCKLSAEIRQRQEIQRVVYNLQMETDRLKVS